MNDKQLKTDGKDTCADHSFSDIDVLCGASFDAWYLYLAEREQYHGTV